MCGLLVLLPCLQVRYHSHGDSVVLDVGSQDFFLFLHGHHVQNGLDRVGSFLVKADYDDLAAYLAGIQDAYLAKEGDALRGRAAG